MPTLGEEMSVSSCVTEDKGIHTVLSRSHCRGFHKKCSYDVLVTVVIHATVVLDSNVSYAL